LESLEELLAAEIDAVCIATPVFVHREHVTRCVRAGKHALCKKSLGLTVQQGQGVVALAQACKIQLGVASMTRFHSQQ
jgi:predicted dehydrogenase